MSERRTDEEDEDVIPGYAAYCGGINPYTLTAKLGLARIDGFGPPERRRAAQLT